MAPASQLKDSFGPADFHLFILLLAEQKQRESVRCMGCALSLPLSIAIPVSYILLLHLFDHKGTDRNAPEFAAATVNNVLAVAATYYALSRSSDDPWKLMGFRIQFDGHLCAVFGQSLVNVIDVCSDPAVWKDSFGQLHFLRDAVMAPITEEIAFRGCGAALMAMCFSQTQTIFIAPLCFSLSHLHHIGDDTRKGSDFKTALANRCFQGLYTYAFGAYATFLFFRTGHIVAPTVTHMLCNCLGLPQFHEIGNYSKKRQRAILWSSYACGILGFTFLVAPLTSQRCYTSL